MLPRPHPPCDTPASGSEPLLPAASPFEPIHRVFEARVALDPEALCLVGRDLRVTYGQLDARANQIAHHLQALGVGPDGLVGIDLERGADLIAAMLGVLKAGGAYLPLDFVLPGRVDPPHPHRRAPRGHPHTQRRAAPSRSGDPADRSGPGRRRGGRDPPGLRERTSRRRTSPTSSSPRARRAGPRASWFLTAGYRTWPRAQRRLFGVSPASRVLQFASFNFDASTFEIVMALSRGRGALPRVRREPRARRRAARLPPRPGGDHGDAAALGAGHPPGHAAARSADAHRRLGEACPPGVVQRWSRRAPLLQRLRADGGHRLRHVSASLDAADGEVAAHRPPAPGASAHVLDAAVQPVPPAEAGSSTSAASASLAGTSGART